MKPVPTMMYFGTINRASRQSVIRHTRPGPNNLAAIVIMLLE